MSLSWSLVPTATSYRVYFRRSSESTYQQTVPTTDSQIWIGGLAPQTQYYFAVQAARSGAESPLSGPVTATTLTSTISIDLFDGNPELLNVEYRYKNRSSLITAIKSHPDLSRQGACADGVSRLLVQISSPTLPSSLTIALVNDIGPQDPTATGSLARFDELSPATSVTLTSSDFDFVDANDYRSVLVYKPPVDFVRASAVSQDMVHLTRDVSITFATSSTVLKLRRPPLVLAHGLWSNPSEAWSTLTTLLPPLYSLPNGTFLLDYETTNASAFSVNVQRLYDKLNNDWLHQVRTSGFACTQVDYVGHSMGGILARFLSQDNARSKSRDTFSAGFLHKLITIDTPHFGTWLANYLLLPIDLPNYMVDQIRCKVIAVGPEVSAMFNLFGYHTLEGAVNDLRFGSPSLTLLDRTSVPSHAITSFASTDDQFRQKDSGLWSAFLFISIQPCSSPVSAFDVASAFHNANHDIIVSHGSQAAGLSGSRVNVLDNNVHSTVCHDPRLPPLVRDLLDASVGNTTLFTEFPPVSTLLPTVLGKTKPEQYGSKIASSTGFGVRIVEPDSSFVPHPGSQFRLRVTVEDTSRLRALFFAAPELLDFDTTGSLTKSILIPYSHAGDYRLLVIAMDKDGNTGRDSLVYSLQPSASLLCLAVSPDSLFLYRTDDGAKITVLGHYSDNAVRDVTNLSSTAFRSSDPSIVQVIGNGIIRPDRQGQTYLTISNGLARDSISVRVVDNNAVLLVEPPNSTTSLSAPITFIWDRVDSATKYEIELSRQVDFGLMELMDSSLTNSSFVYSPRYDSTYYFWRVRAKTSAGWQPFSPTRIFGTGATVTSVIENIPLEFRLEQNYPNPFNPFTTIRYEIPKQTKVTLKIYNILGQVVKTLVDEVQAPGKKSVQWNSRNNAGNQVASGVYFYRILAGSFIQTKKLILLR